VRKAYRIFVGGLTERKLSHGRSNCSWQNNIKNGLEGTGGGIVNSVQLAQNAVHLQALANEITNFFGPLETVNLLTACKTLSYLRDFQLLRLAGVNICIRVIKSNNSEPTYQQCSFCRYYTCLVS
jgi:hypothetical protein